MPKLTIDEVAESMARLPGWAKSNDQIEKTFEFPAYLDGLEFAMSLGQEAEKRDHHPDMTLTWRKVKVSLSTHSEGGITEKDIGLAEFAETL